MVQPLKVLLVEDNPNDAELLLLELRRAGFEPDWHRVETEAAFLEKIEGGLDLILSDYQMPQFTGLRALELLKERGLDVPFILVSGTIGEDTAVSAMKKGATDYLLKDRLVRLGPAVMHALRGTRLRHERMRAEAALRRQQTELRVLFDLIPAMIWFKDTANVVLRVNQKVAEAAGKTVEEIEGRPSLEIYPRDPASSLADDWEVIRSGVPKLGIVEKLRGPGGREVWVHTDKVPYCDEHGKVVGIVVMAQDITERRRADLQIRDQLAELLRWQEVMLNREERVEALKTEINELLKERNQPPRYSSPLAP